MTDERELEREHRAKQRLRIIEEFREHGRVDVNDMLRLGHPITRTAAVIWKLRQEWGPDLIITVRRPRNTCVYYLAREPEVWVTPRKPRKAKGWTCNVCGNPTLFVDTRLSPTLGKSQCDTCGKLTMFRLR